MQTTSLVERWNRWSRAHVGTVDAVLAGPIVLFAVAAALAVDESSPAVVVVALALSVPLVWRRMYPVAAGGIVAVASYAHLAFLPELGPGTAIAVPVAVYSLAAYAPRWAANVALVAAVAGGAGAGARYLSPPGSRPFDVAVMAVLVAVFLGGIWAFGRVRGLRLREVTSLTERNRLLELERLKEAELAATQERTRIAREMHDIVAHSLTAIIAQADGGRYAAAQHPETATEVFATISETGRGALTDMRSLLSVLREDSPREFTTTPGLGDLGALIDRMGDSGLDVTFTETGTPREVSDGLGLSVYRIVQESLTNVLKHAGPSAHAEVTLDWRPDRLVVETVDDGRGAAALVEARPGGQGLTGIDERARLHGGTAVSGPRARDGGGYRVRVTVPA